MNSDNALKELKDMAFKEELAFQLKLRPDADRNRIEAQVRERIYGTKKFGKGRQVRGMGIARKGTRACKMR